MKDFLGKEIKEGSWVIFNHPTTGGLALGLAVSLSKIQRHLQVARFVIGDRGAKEHIWIEPGLCAVYAEGIEGLDMFKFNLEMYLREAFADSGIIKPLTNSIAFYLADDEYGEKIKNIKDFELKFSKLIMEELVECVNATCFVQDVIDDVIADARDDEKEKIRKTINSVGEQLNFSPGLTRSILDFTLNSFELSKKEKENGTK